MKANCHLPSFFRFIPEEAASFTHWIEDWLSPRIIVDVVVKTEIPVTAVNRT
jgi:hypothetical protein